MTLQILLETLVSAHNSQRHAREVHDQIQKWSDNLIKTFKNACSTTRQMFALQMRIFDEDSARVLSVLCEQAFDTTSISVLNNQIASTKVGGQALCIRGIGDRFTNNAVDVPFPSSCEQALKITLTHDPAAAFDFDLSGLIFAGHTHCGQVSFPFLGPLWVPTTAPKEAHCGLYQDDKKSLFVSSGTGTSLLPIRFGAPAQWDLIRLEPKN